MSDIFFEDIEVGARRELGDYTFTQDEIIAFAKKYDPQIFHLDPEAAMSSIFGGLIASGWHTAAIWMKLSLAARERETVGGARTVRAGVSPGFTDLQWLKPVRPGMKLIFSSEVTNKTELKSRPNLGIVESRNQAHDEHGTLVFSFLGKGFVERRPR